MNKAYTLIAHRGYSGKYPENTLLAYQAAYACGARWFECDIQLTADLEPIVHHDQSLLRMTGKDMDIRSVNIKDLNSYSAYYPERFDTQFIGNRLCHLSDLASWLQLDKSNQLFVEVKQHSIDKFGLDTCIDKVQQAIVTCETQCIIISFNADIVELAKSKYGLNNGWVIPEWSEKVKLRADQMQPDYLFSSKRIMPDNSTDWWEGQWHWANYNVDDASEVATWVNKGLQFIETNEIGDLMRCANMKEFASE